MRCNPWRWLWGLLPIAMWSWITVLGEHERIERDLVDRSGEVLAQQGLSWAQSSFVGRDGRLEGIADEDGAADRAAEIVRAVWGVRVVDARAQLIEQVDDYQWSASYGGNRIKLSGYVPNEPTRKAIVGVAKANFPNSDIVDEMTAARGAPDRDAWLGGIAFSLRQLAALRTGVVDLDPSGLSMAGEAATLGAYKTVRGELRSNLPKGFRLVQERISPPRVSPYTWKAELSATQLVLSGHVSGEEARQQIFDLAKARFPKRAIVDRMEAGSGAGEGFARAAEGAIELLSLMQEGSVAMSDLKLVLSGRVADEATAGRVRASLASAIPANFSVSEKLTFPAPLPATVSPFLTRMTGSAEQLELGGYVPSEGARADMSALVVAAFPKAVIKDQMQLASGAPEGWKACMEAGLLAFKRLGTATVELTDRRLVVMGRTEDETLPEKLAGEVRAIANRACETEVRLDVDRPPEPQLSWRVVHAGEGEVVLEGKVPDGATRAELFSLAGTVFPGARVIDNMQIEAAHAGKWPKVAQLGTRLLGKLRRGSATISGYELEVRGEARDSAVATSVKDQLGREIIKGYRGVDVIEVRSDAMIWAEQEARRRAEAQRLKDEEAAARKRQQEEAEARARAEQAEAQRLEAEAARKRQQEEAESRARAEQAEAERRRLAESAQVAQRKREEADACQVKMRSIASQGVIRFGWASATLEPESLPTLQLLAEVANACPRSRIEIEGHTDAEGTPERNSNLSERRAQAVVSYLTSAGVDASRLSAVGYGETRPVAPNDTPEGRARNRRIEFTVLPD